MMTLTITLTDSNIRSLQWAEAHGYMPDGWTDLLVATDDPAIFAVPEHAAWQLSDFEEEDGDAFLSCMPPDVVEAIRGLMDEVL